MLVWGASPGYKLYISRLGCVLVGMWIGRLWGVICACVYGNVCAWKGVRCIIIRIIRANQLFITCIISLRPLGSLCAGGAGVELNQIGDLATWRGCGRTSSAADGWCWQAGKGQGCPPVMKREWRGVIGRGRDISGLGRQEGGSVGWAGGEDQC